MGDTCKPAGARHTIVVCGRISDRLGAVLGAVTLEREPGRTVIHARADRAGLQALLDALADLGLEASLRDEDR